LSPTQRTLKWLRDKGLTVWIVERYIRNPALPGGGMRIDFLGIIDIIALNNKVTIGVQSCGSSFSEHRKKILESEMAVKWLRGKNRRLLLIGWRKLKKKRGGKQMVWRPRFKTFQVSDFC